MYKKGDIVRYLHADAMYEGEIMYTGDYGEYFVIRKIPASDGIALYMDKVQPEKVLERIKWGTRSEIE